MSRHTYGCTVMLRPLWRRVADFVRHTPLHPQWLLGPREAVAPWLRHHARGRVLDVGCADCWIRDRLDSSCEYFGLDYPATGKARYGAQPHVFADAGQLPVASDSFDTVVMLEVLEHLPAPGLALQEAVRVLKPGGQLLLSMPFLYPIHDAPYDFQRYTVHGLQREIASANLCIMDIQHTRNAAESGGLLLSLALGGITVQAIEQRRISIVLTPLLLAAIPVLNICAWLAGKLFPPWPAVTTGYILIASKPHLHNDAQLGR